MKFKSEARSTKLETNSNDQNLKQEKRCVLNICFLNFKFVSDFEIRISDLVVGVPFR